MAIALILALRIKNGFSLGELKRRNVVRVAIAYAIVSWLLLQISDVILDNIEAPTWVFQATLLLLVIGFPVAIIFAWAFELTPEGLKKEKDVDRSDSITHITGRKLDFVIIGVLVAAVGFLLVDKLNLAGSGAIPDEVTATERQSIAVLPFVNMSEDPNNEFFADGISEEILNLLAKIPELQVTSRSSAFSLKGQNLDVPTMAARLNVAHVLEGSVRKSGNQLRITAQLIEVDADTHLWSETYDRELQNVFAIQDEIAAAVADALQITLLGNKPTSIETNPDAYASYLQARHFMNLDNVGANHQAETLIKQALDIDPGFAPAWIVQGYVYLQQAQIFGLRTYDDANNLARRAFEQALVVDPQYGSAYAGLAYLAMDYDWNFDQAAEHLRQAQALSPGSSDILGALARLHVSLGRIDEAIALYQQSIALDPISNHGGLGVALHFAGRLDEAADSLEMALSLNPNNVYVPYLLAHVRLAQGDTAAALIIIEAVPDDGWRLAGSTIVHHALGNSDASDAALEELIERFSTDMAYQIAMAYGFRGKIDSAFEWLEMAYQNHDSGLTNLLLDPTLTNLHNEPRWTSFIDRMGYPE